MLTANHLVIPIDNAIATFWRTKFPDLVDLFVGDDFYLTISPGSYRPIWGTASTVTQGYRVKFVDHQCHKLEGFDVNLAAECNCASVYYLLKDLEQLGKDATCGTYTGILVRDYIIPDLADIKANLDYSERYVLLEVEQTTGSMGLGSDRSYFGTKLMLSILDEPPVIAVPIP